MPTTAIVHSVPPRDTSSTSGSVNSIAVPRCAANDAARGGPQVLGVVAVQPALGRARAVPRRVADHHRHDEREVPVELGRRGAPPDADEHELRGDEQVADREQEHEQQQPVQFRARAQERHLVAQAEQHEQAEQHGDRGGVEAAGRGAGDGVAVRQQQVDAGRRARPRTAPRRAACASIRGSAERARATAAGASCPGAASRGCRRSAA